MKPLFGKRQLATRLLALGFSLAIFSTPSAADETPTSPPPPAFAPPEILEPSLDEEGATPPTETPAKASRSKKTSQKSGSGTLIENGENGLAGVENHTDSSYDLLQNSVSAQGDYAFHLATQLGHWFKPTPSVMVSSDSKLFFLSRLGWATSDQVATVQVSTDGGTTWPSTIWTQAGTGTSGESGFSLKEIDLSSFAGSTIQVRFLYDFDFGSFFPQTSTNVGWLVDNIQIGATFSKEPYLLFGDPSDDEQHYLEFINRARASAAAEAQRLRDETDPQITSAYSSFGIDLNDITAQFAWHVSSGCMAEAAQPLAFNTKLLLMSRLHTQDMFDNSFQGHVSSSSPPAPFQPGDTLGDRRDHVGYSGGLGENVYSYAKSVSHGHAGFDVDWGNTTNTGSTCYNAAFVGQGMQNPPGHRLSIHNPSYREAGIGVINGSNGGVGPQLVTQNFGTGGGTVITGVVYEDSNTNGFYDPGEGIPDVRIETPDSAFYSLTSASGGYAIPVDSDDVHPVTFSEGGVTTTTLSATVSGGNNTKLDYVAVILTPYEAWALSLGVTGGAAGDHDEDGIQNLLEYALLNSDPLVANANLAVTLIESGGDGIYTINKNPSATTLNYIVETSTNYETWSPSGYTVLTDNDNILEVRLDLPVSAEFGFVRILVSEGP